VQITLLSSENSVCGRLEVHMLHAPPGYARARNAVLVSFRLDLVSLFRLDKPFDPERDFGINTPGFRCDFSPETGAARE
jgi:hypothetical protein